MKNHFKMTKKLDNMQFKSVNPVSFSLISYLVTMAYTNYDGIKGLSLYLFSFFKQECLSVLCYTTKWLTSPHCRCHVTGILYSDWLRAFFSKR